MHHSLRNSFTTEFSWISSDLSPTQRLMLHETARSVACGTAARVSRRRTPKKEIKYQNLEIIHPILEIFYWHRIILDEPQHVCFFLCCQQHLGDFFSCELFLPLVILQNAFAFLNIVPRLFANHRELNVFSNAKVHRTPQDTLGNPLECSLLQKELCPGKYSNTCRK